MISQKIKRLIQFIKTDTFLALLYIPDKSYAYPHAPGKLDLRKTGFLAYLSNFPANFHKIPHKKFDE